MKNALMFILRLAVASTMVGTFVYLLDCAISDSLEAWFAANPECRFMPAAVAAGYIFGSFRAGQRKGGRHD